MSRAKDFIAVGEHESARSELRVQLHNDPDDVDAKALLLYLSLAEGGVAGAADCLVPRSTVEPGSTAEGEALDRVRMDVRKAALDDGISTRDWAEYEEVLDASIEYGWKSHQYGPGEVNSKLVFAFCAALGGDEAGSEYLVDHLAQEDVKSNALPLLYLLGDPAVPALVKVAGTTEHLARESAESALRDLQLAKLLASVDGESSERANPSAVHVESKRRKQSGGKYLMSLGWKDSNAGLEAVFAAASARSSMAGAPSRKQEHPLVVRRADVGRTELVTVTVALPSSSKRLAEQDGLQPAGAGVTFQTRSWSWETPDWKPLTIDGKPSVSGPDLALLSIHGPAPGVATSDVDFLGPSQVAWKVYRGIRTTKKKVKVRWYGERTQTVEEPVVEYQVFHLGPGGLESVKTVGLDGEEASKDQKGAADPAAVLGRQDTGFVP